MIGGRARTCTDARARSLAREEKGRKACTIDFWREFWFFTCCFVLRIFWEIRDAMMAKNWKILVATVAMFLSTSGIAWAGSATYSVPGTADPFLSAAPSGATCCFGVRPLPNPQSTPEA